MSIVDALLNAALCRLLAEVLFRLGCPGIVARLSTKPGATALARSRHSQIKRERLQSAYSGLHRQLTLMCFLQPGKGTTLPPQDLRMKRSAR